MTLSEQDWHIRLYIYQHFVEHTLPPTVVETAEHFDIGADECRTVYQRLHDHHALYLQPGTATIRMANPLSAVKTDYRVYIRGHWLYANCAWDSLGIPAMLGDDALIEARLPLSSDIVRYEIVNRELIAPPAYVHFPLPFARWYDDLVDT
ncbi:MAG: organomercurial lyase [Anaerolineae bacterium]